LKILTEFKYVENNLTYPNFIQEEINEKLNLGNIPYELCPYFLPYIKTRIFK